MVFGRFIDFINPERIHIGKNSVISNRCCLHAGDTDDYRAEIKIESDVFIGIGTSLRVENANIHLMCGANLGSECLIVAKDSLTIGQNVLVAAYCTIGEIDGVANERRGITYIGNDVWLGARSHVRPAVNIDNGAIVGAHALVESSVAAYGIVVGRPATLQRLRK